MKRSALALAASVIALALMAGPAAAEPGAGQAVDDSTGALQVGAVAVDVPVRVASGGNSATPGVSAAGPQTTGDSTGAAQVAAVDADTPVRVLSDGDDAEAATPVAGEQSTRDSLGSAQVGAIDAAAPVRVASDGDNSSADGAGGDASSGRQAVNDSSGSAQVGSPSLFAPVRILNGGSTPLDDLVDSLLGSPSGGNDVVGTPAAVGPTAGDAPHGRDWPSPEELRGLLDGPNPDPAIRFASGGAGDAPGYAQVLGASAASLPLTGAAVMPPALLGLWLLASGLALRLVPGGKRR